MKKKSQPQAQQPALPPGLQCEAWPTSKPIPYARNPRKIPQSAIDKVAASIQEFGFRQPIVVDAKGVIVVGHTRLLAAQKLGLPEVPVHVALDLTPAQAKAYRIADNRASQEAEFDLPVLALEFEDLKALDFDLGLTGFDPNEIEAFSEGGGGPTDKDRAPGVPEVPVPVRGDLWLLGAYVECPRCHHHNDV